MFVISFSDICVFVQLWPLGGQFAHRNGIYVNIGIYTKLQCACCSSGQDHSDDAHAIEEDEQVGDMSLLSAATASSESSWQFLFMLEEDHKVQVQSVLMLHTASDGRPRASATTRV